MRRTLKSALMTCFVLALLAASADAVTLTESFTNTHLKSYGSYGSSARTLSGSEVSTPDLDFESNGLVTTNMKMLESGTSEIDQDLRFSAISYPESYGFKSYSWFSTANSYVSGTKVTNADSLVTTTAGVTHPSFDNTKVQTIGYGMGMAVPQSGTYDLSVTGGHCTVTNAAPVPVPMWMAEDPKFFTMTFKPDSLELKDAPAAFFDQGISLSYGVDKNDLAFYAYDFSRNLEIEDIRFRSHMKYGENL